MSADLAFSDVRQQLSTLQRVLPREDAAITSNMVQWIERIQVESIVVVMGKI